MSKREIHVLGIETSCDDTCVAIVNQDGKILSNCADSQLKQHLIQGGINPIDAKDGHVASIDRVARQAFAESGLGSVGRDIDAIAVTNRPGLQWSLKVGLNYGRQLAKKYSKPLIPIDHMHAHALTPLIENPKIRFPFLALLISGGHCLLSVAKRYNDFHLLGSSRDDAPGDVLDKMARRFKLRNLGPPFDSISGGASIELLASQPTADRFKYFNCQSTIPMININSCDFSFTGYGPRIEETSPIIDELWLHGKRDQLLEELGHICASLQRIMLIQMLKKVHRAIYYYRMFWRHPNSDAFANDQIGDHLGYELNKFDHDGIDLLVSGGVSTNRYFVDNIKRICQESIDPETQLYVPSKKLCCDNGAMIAWNGMLRYRDFLAGNLCEAHENINNTVVCDASLMDTLIVHPRYSMGLDLSAEVRQRNFSLARLRHPEIKVPPLDPKQPPLKPVRRCSTDMHRLSNQADV